MSDDEGEGEECVDDKSSEIEISNETNLTNKQLSIYNSVSLGLYHGLAISKEKGVYTWGSIWHNAMGLGISNGEVREPKKIPFFEDKSILQVSCGDAHSAVLVACDSNYLGNIYTFGLGNNGRLGYTKSGQETESCDLPIIDKPESNDKAKKITKPSRIKLNRKVSLEEVLTSETSVSDVNNQSWFSIRPFKVKLKYKVKLISCGSAHTLVICEDCSLWSWGCGDFGVLGLGSTYDVYEPTKVDLDNVTHVSAGARHSLAIANNSLYSWGYGANGRLGLYHSKNVFDPSLVNGKELDVPVYVSAGQSHSGCVNSKGEVFTWGSGQGGRLGHSWSLNGDLNYPHKLNIEGVSFQSISCGMAHTVALSDDGDIYFWGTLTNQSNIPISISIGSRAICVNSGPCGVALVTIDGDLASWGIGGYYRLGHSTIGDYSIPTFIPELRGSIGLFRVKKTDSSKSNEVLSHVIDVECGESHVCVLCNDGTVYAWGRSLGSGATENFGTLNNPEKIVFKTRIDVISCGKNHCLALSRDGNVYSWGSNKCGQLGLGDLSYRIEPSQVEGLENVLGIKASYDASAMIISSSEELKSVRVGSLMVCGNANNYKLGLKDISSGVIMSPMNVVVDEPVFKVEIGENHSMLISLSGKLYVAGSFGSNTYHTFTNIPLVNEDGESEVIYQAIPGTSHSAVLSTSGNLYVCGKRHSVCSVEDIVELTRFLSLPNKQPVKYIHVFGDVTIAITIDGKSWRWGFFGKETIYSPEEIKPVRDVSMDKIVGTFNFGIGISSHKIIFSWGKNDYGQLGRGFDGKFDPEARVVQVIETQGINSLDAIDREHKMELMLIQIKATGDVEWKKLFEIIKYEPFRQRELFLYSTEQTIIRSLQQIVVLFLNENNEKLKALQKKRGEIIANMYGCKSCKMENLSSIIRILYLQPAYLSKLIFVNPQVTLMFIEILFSNISDEYTSSVLMTLYRMVVFAEIKTDFTIPKSISIMKLFNKTGFNYKVKDGFKPMDLVSLIETFPITPFVEKMLYFTLLLFKRELLSMELANVNLAKAYFNLILESVDSNGATIAEFKKKIVYDALIMKITGLEEQNRRLNYNLQYQLTNELFNMHFQPNDLYFKIPCTLVYNLYQASSNVLNRLNMSLNDPLVSILSKGLESKPCKGIQHIFIDRRFISSDKNLSFCTYSNIPVPQRYAYRQTSYIDSPPPREMQQIYELEEVKNPIHTFTPHRMLSPIFRYHQPNRYDVKWLVQQSLRVIRRFNSEDLIGVLKSYAEEYVNSREFSRASLLEETLALIEDMEEKELSELGAGLLEMQQKRSVHHRYLTLVLESHKNLIKKIPIYKDRVEKEISKLGEFINKFKSK